MECSISHDNGAIMYMKSPPSSVISGPSKRSLVAQDVLSQGHAGASIVRLNVDRGHLSALDDNGIAL